jgi:hypothetical protein
MNRGSVLHQTERLVAAGDQKSKAGDFYEAGWLYLEAIAHCEWLFGAHNTVVNHILRRLARTYLASGRIAEAARIRNLISQRALNRFFQVA